MKHSTKIILLVSAGLVSFGLILSAIGLICGGSLSNIMNHGLWRFTGYQKIHYDNTFDKDNTYHVSASSIHSIDVDWIDGDISVVPYDGDDIILTESSNKELDDEYCLRYRIKSGKLLIEYCKSKYYIGLDLSEEDNFPTKTLEIKVPKDLAENLQELSVDAISSDVQLEDIGSEEFSIDTISGNLSGTLLLADEITFDSTSGSMDLKLSHCPSSFEMYTISGDCTLYLPKKTGLTCEFDTISGDFDSEFDTYPEDDEGFIIGSGKASFEFSSTSGSMTVKKLKH